MIITDLQSKKIHEKYIWNCTEELIRNFQQNQKEKATGSAELKSHIRL